MRKYHKLYERQGKARNPKRNPDYNVDLEMQEGGVEGRTYITGKISTKEDSGGGLRFNPSEPQARRFLRKNPGCEEFWSLEQKGRASRYFDSIEDAMKHFEKRVLEIGGPGPVPGGPSLIMVRRFYKDGWGPGEFGDSSIRMWDRDEGDTAWDLWEGGVQTPRSRPRANPKKNPGRACPKCKARAGNPCKTASGKKAAKPHAARLQGNPISFLRSRADPLSPEAEAVLIELCNHKDRYPNDSGIQGQKIGDRFADLDESVMKNMPIALHQLIDSGLAKLVESGRPYYLQMSIAHKKRWKEFILEKYGIRADRKDAEVLMGIVSATKKGQRACKEMLASNPKKKAKKRAKKKSVRKKKILVDEPTIGEPTKGRPIYVGVVGRPDYQVRVSLGPRKVDKKTVYYAHIIDASGSVVDGEKKGRLGPYADPDDAARMGQLIVSITSGADEGLEAAAENPGTPQTRRMHADARRAFARPNGILDIVGKGTVVGDVVGGIGATDPTAGVAQFTPDEDLQALASLPDRDPAASFRLGYYYGILRGFDYCKWCVSPVGMWERWKFRREFRQRLIDASNELARSALEGRIGQTGRVRRMKQ